MAEWSIAQPWKGCERLRVPRVRIPVCPPLPYKYYNKNNDLIIIL